MRTIKFRGKAIPCNEWVYGSYVKMENETKTIQRHAIMDVADTDNKFIKSGKDYQMSLSVVEKNTIGQFTCLHDKNGKEIYEGDIVKYLSYAREEVGYIGFHARSASFRVIAEHTDYGIGNRGELHELELEVIGNIYDNPELLKEK